MAETDSGDWSAASSTLDGLSVKTRELTNSASAFSRAMTQAFTSSVSGGKALDDVLKTLALRVSNIALKAAMKPLDNALSGALSGLFSGGISTTGSSAIQPFAAGGVISSPGYFAMPGGGLGLAGEAGPEAIMPLARGADGRLGVHGGGGNSIHVSIATPDADSFRRSESYITGQIARAVARGQRGM